MTGRTETLPIKTKPSLKSGHSTDDENGYALISVLWSLLILSTISAAIISASVFSHDTERNHWKSINEQLALDAGTQRAILALLDKRTEASWNIAGPLNEYEFQRTNLLIAIEDEIGKIDLNTAERALLHSLVLSAGGSLEQANQISDRILDWRSPGNTKRLNGADASDYHEANLNYRPRGEAFESADELRYVLGVTPALFAKMRPAVTVFSKKRTIDLRTAPPIARSALLRLRPDEHSQQETEQSTISTKDFFAQLEGRVFTIKVRRASEKPTRALETVVMLTGEKTRPYLTMDRRLSYSK